MSFDNVKQSDIDNTEIMDDETIENIGQEVNDLIELLDDDADNDNDSTAIHFPGLTLKSTKRNHENINNGNLNNKDF